MQKLCLLISKVSSLHLLIYSQIHAAVYHGKQIYLINLCNNGGENLLHKILLHARVFFTNFTCWSIYSFPV